MFGDVPQEFEQQTEELEVVKVISVVKFRTIPKICVHLVHTIFAFLSHFFVSHL